MSAHSTLITSPESSWEKKVTRTLSAKHIELKEFCREQTEAVAAFLSTYFVSSAERWVDGLEHTYWKNPNVGVGNLSGWVLYAEDRVVGFHGNVLHPFQAADLTVKAASASSWCVAPECRPLGVGLLLARTFLEQTGVDLLFMTTAGEIAAKLFTRWGAVRVPTEWYDEILFWVVDAAGFLGGAVEFLIGSQLAARMVSSAISIPLFLSRKGHFLSSLEHGDGEIDDIAHSGPEWARCWEEWRPGLITGVRTPQQLSWRLKGPQKYWLSFRDDNNNLLGYAAARVDKNGSLSRLRIIDMWADPARLEVLCSMVTAAKSLARKVGCSCVEVCGLSEKYRHVLQALRPYRRRMSRWPYFIFVRDKELKSLLARPEAWHPSEYDGDSPFSIMN